MVNPRTKANLYSVREVAKILGKSPSTVMKMIKNKELMAHKVGWVWVIPESEVEKAKSRQ